MPMIGEHQELFTDKQPPRPFAELMQLFSKVQVGGEHNMADSLDIFIPWQGHSNKAEILTDFLSKFESNDEITMSNVTDQSEIFSKPGLKFWLNTIILLLLLIFALFKLNDFFIPIFKNIPPSSLHGKNIQIKYCTQLKSNPPVFAFFSNEPKLIKKNYRRFIEKKIREQYVNMLRKNLIKSRVVRNFFETSEKVKKQLSFEQFVEEYLLDIHMQNKFGSESKY